MEINCVMSHGMLSGVYPRPVFDWVAPFRIPFARVPENRESFRFSAAPEPGKSQHQPPEYQHDQTGPEVDVDIEGFVIDLGM